MRVALDDRAVRGEGVQVHLGQRLALQFGRHPLRHAHPSPAVEADVDLVPVPELARQAAPGAALIEHVKPSGEHLAVRDLEMIARWRQQPSQPPARTAGRSTSSGRSSDRRGRAADPPHSATTTPRCRQALAQAPHQVVYCCEGFCTMLPSAFRIRHPKPPVSLVNRP